MTNRISPSANRADTCSSELASANSFASVEAILLPGAKSEAEMRQVFPQYGQAIDNTQAIAERCQVTFDFKHLHLPHYPIDTGETAEEMLTRLCKKGLEALYPEQWADPESEPEMENPAEPETPESPAEAEKSDETEDTPHA